MKTKSVITVSLTLVFVLFLTLTLVVVFATNSRSAIAQAETSIANEDFSDGAGIFGSNVSVTNGEATIVTENSLFSLNIPNEKLLPSNNYEISFDLKLNSDSEVFFHLIGLDNNSANIYLGISSNGQYIRLSDFYGHDVYNNSGEDQGGLNGAGIDLTKYAHFEIIHYEGYLELWVDGTRRIVSHLSNFGNNQYLTRAEITEGTITGFGFHAVKPNAVVLDNFKITEAVAKDAFYKEITTSTDTNIISKFGLSAQNLYKQNFSVNGNFAIADENATNYFPKIRIFGLNASLHECNQRSYGVNFQFMADKLNFTPQIFWQTDGEEWSGKTDAIPIALESGKTLNYKIEVFGDRIKFWANGNVAYDTTFTDLGFKKGRPQYIWVQNGGGGAYWKNFEYRGFDNETAAVITGDCGDVVMSGSNVTLNADMFGADTDETFSWYVNGEKQTETSKTLTLNGIAAKNYKIEYKSDNFKSDVFEFTAVERKITVEADKTEIYPDDECVVTAVLVGDFSAESLKWYVNEVEQLETSPIFLFSGHPAGEYKIRYACENITSNEVIVVVKKAEINLTSEKKIYNKGETATINAEITGMPDTDIVWYVNSKEISGVSGNELVIDTSVYEKGKAVTVKAISGDIESEELTFLLVYDVIADIIADENYKVISSLEISEDGSYGNYGVGIDDGNYLYAKAGGFVGYGYSGQIPTETGFIMEYKLFVPSDISAAYYVYPILFSLDSKYNEVGIEAAMCVNETGFSPYLKNQSTLIMYDESNYGFGKDLSYEGIAKKGEWNTIRFAVYNSCAAMYINGEEALFVVIPTLSVPSRCDFCMYPDGGTSVIPLKMKDISFSSITTPAPALTGVNISLGKITAGVNEKVNVTANLVPFNAEAVNIEWYINDKKTDSSSLNFVFSADKAGDYKIKCVVDGISSSEKVIKVDAPDKQDDSKKSVKDNKAGAIAGGIIGGLAAVGFAIGIVFIVKKKRFTKK